MMDIKSDGALLTVNICAVFVQTVLEALFTDEASMTDFCNEFHELTILCEK